MKISVNGTIVEETEAMIPAYDHGFLYGIGLFETFRTVEGKPFLLEEHLDRLLSGCRALGMEHHPAISAVESQVRQLLEANSLQDAYVRYTVSAGVEALGLTSNVYAAPNVVIYMKPLPDFPSELYERGKLLQRVTIRRNTPEGSVRFKALHFMNNALAYRELAAYEWLQGKSVEGLMLDHRGYLAEGITSNVFWVQAGKLMTPSIDTGILPGVTRAWVIKQAMKSDGVEEGFFSWNQFIQADEVFITNSIQGIVPVYGVYDEKGHFTMIGNGHPGEYTQRFMQQYRKAMMG